MTDIDIEEHDVLENPILKVIFPDLTKLKKEIIDFNEDKTSVNFNEEDINKTAVLKPGLSCYSNASLNCYEDKQELVNLNNITVVLDNINIFLMKSQRFCTHCLILFPDISAFNNHQMLFHIEKVCINEIDKRKSKNNNSKNSNLRCKNVIRNMQECVNNKRPKLSLESSGRSCTHCDMLFPTEKSLIDHLYDILNAKKSQTSFQKSQKPNTPHTVKQTFISNLKTTDLKKDIFNEHSNTVLSGDNWIFYFCNTCKCYIPQNCRVDIHIQSICKKIIKYTCEYCGLSLPQKSTKIHQEIHFKNSDINLQDFSFYDVKTKSKIKPCQILPKCNSCEIYFVKKSEITAHICNKEENLDCPICGIKLSVSAHKLHLPFHNYTLKNDMQNNFSVNKISNNETVNNNLANHTDVDSVKEESKSLSQPTDNELNYNHISAIYTCKNCDLSMNEYDDVVKHCQLHNNLNDLRLDSIECVLCNLKFISSTYEIHHNLHSSFTKDKFKQFIFDILYFGSTNEDWLKHLFGDSSKSSINKYIMNSIYKDECRIKLDIIQEGPEHRTIYKCGKCNIIIDAPSIYEHMTKCRINVKKFSCKSCNLSFVNKLLLHNHESIHNNSNITGNFYRIVIFNQQEHEAINTQIANTKKYYTLYQCRFCLVLVDYNTYEKHVCYMSDFKKCNKCGLLIQEAEHNLHMRKHDHLTSFNTDFMYVILLGKTRNYTQKKNNERTGIVPTFSGMISDYTFYKCSKCELCLRDRRSVFGHHCLISAAKLECPKCYLIFEERKLKGHLRLHENDPNFTKDTIMIKTFGINGICDDMSSSVGDKTNCSEIFNSSASDIVKIYKCSCGLHFLNKVMINEHSRGCCGKIKLKQSKQNCLKCGLTFSHDILFKHLLKHHRGKNVIFKYEIIKM